MSTVKTVTITCDGPCRQVVTGRPPANWVVLKAEHVGEVGDKQHMFARFMVCDKCFEIMIQHGYRPDTDPNVLDRRPKYKSPAPIVALTQPQS